VPSIRRARCTRVKARVSSAAPCLYRSLPLQRLGGMRFSAFLVLDDLAVELVDQEVDGRVQVLVVGFAVNVLSTHVKVDFGFLPKLVD